MSDSHPGSGSQVATGGGIAAAVCFRVLSIDGFCVGTPQMWAGASEAEILSTSIPLDAPSREAVKAIWFHTRMLEKERGPPEGRPTRIILGAAAAEEAAEQAAAGGGGSAEGEDQKEGSESVSTSGTLSEVFITSEGKDDESNEDEAGDDRGVIERLESAAAADSHGYPGVATRVPAAAAAGAGAPVVGMAAASAGPPRVSSVAAEQLAPQVAPPPVS